MRVRDRNGRWISASEALEQSVMDRHGAVSHDGRRLTLADAIERQVVRLEPEPPATRDQGKKVIQFGAGGGQALSFRAVGQPVVEEHQESWSFDSQSGRLTSDTGASLTLDQALRAGTLAPEDLRVRDALTGREMGFKEAEQWGIIDARQGYYLDKTENRRCSFTEAAQQHRIYPTGGVPEHAGDAVHTTMRVQTRSETAKKEAVPVGPNAGGAADYSIARLFDSASGKLRHPESGEHMTLKQAIFAGILDPYHIKVIDRRRGRELHLLAAIEESIVNDADGTVEDTATGRKYGLGQALRESK